ncbi:MAG TPA: hypothetical protein VJ558_08510, partial [Bacillales bacterium]|nr:hypothetical protein [Bacillales bacterium]
MERLHEQFIRIRKLLDITFFRVLFFLVIGIILFLVMFNNVKPEKLDLSLFKVADQTIRSPGTVEDKESTEKKRNEALDQVKDVYIVKKEYTENRVDLITSIFDSAKEVNEELKAQNSQPNTDPIDKVGKLKGKLTENVTKDLSDQVLTALVQATNDELSIAKDFTVTAINDVMSKRIAGNNVENAKKKVEEELKYTSLSKGLKNASIELGRYAVIQNEFYDPKATEELRQQAAESVEPVKILQGQIIVEEGELIDREIFRRLKLVGLLDNENSYKPFFG